MEELILDCELPFELFRTDGFCTFMERMQPVYTVIVVIPLFEEGIRGQDEEGTEEAEPVTVMMDAWTNRRMVLFKCAMATRRGSGIFCAAMSRSSTLQ